MAFESDGKGDLDDAVRDVLGGGDHDAPQRLIGSLAIEEPEALRPYLRSLFGVPAMRRRIMEGWRAADDATVSFLFSIVKTGDRNARDRRRRKDNRRHIFRDLFRQRVTSVDRDTLAVPSQAHQDTEQSTFVSGYRKA